MERRVDVDAPPLDSDGEPASGFVASDPKPLAPEVSSHGEPFASVADPDSLEGVPVDISGLFTEKEERQHQRKLAAIRYARGLGPKPLGPVGRIIYKVFGEDPSRPRT